MAADRRMIAELFVLDRWFAGSNRVEEVCLVGRDIAVIRRRGKSLRLDDLVIERPGLRDVPLPTAPDIPCAAVPASPLSNRFLALGLCPAV